MNAEVIRGNELRREVWRFWFIDHATVPQIRLDCYSVETKESIRKRKWQQESMWNSHDHRSSRIQNPPLPLDVEAEAKEQFINQIRQVKILVHEGDSK